MSTEPAKHTPGTWSVSELGASGERSEFYIFIEPGVAVIERSVKGQDQFDMNDAHLLSAAKDLLAGIEEALEFAEDQEDITDGPDGKPQPNKAMQLAQTLRAAIKKATGEAA